VLAFVILYGLGDLTAIDAFFLAVSGNTESGLNTYVGPLEHQNPSMEEKKSRLHACRNSVDVKNLKVAQQLVLYFFPIITNLCFVNIGLVFIRLSCFEKRLKSLGMDPWSFI